MKKLAIVTCLLILSLVYTAANCATAAITFQKKAKKDSVGDLNKQRSPKAIKNRRQRDQMQLSQKRRHEKQADSIRKVQQEFDKRYPGN